MHPTWAPNCMQNLKGGWKFSFPKMFDSYRDMFPIGLLLNVGARASVMFFWKILVFIFLMFGLSFAVVNSIKMIFVIKLRLHEGRRSPVVIWLCPLIFFNLLRWNLSKLSQFVKFVLPIILKAENRLLLSYYQYFVSNVTPIRARDVGVETSMQGRVMVMVMVTLFIYGKSFTKYYKMIQDQLIIPK